MATQTTNYGLTKPAWDDMVDVSVLNNNSDIIDAQMKANETSAANAVANMADAYDATATYSVGDYCTYNGQLYICTTAVSTAEAFDISKWTATTAAEHFSDGGGGGGGGDTLIQPVIYSDTEREIGVWRDGKPLYQKTINFGALPNATSKSVAHGITNLDRVVYGISIAKNNNNVTLILPYVNSGSDRVGTYVDNNNVNIETNTNVSTYTDTYVTLRYTKTTDTPGSGTWTPSGVPAVHYSTDEQVMGTWIDGKTLYQKTLTYNSSISLNDSSWTTIPFMGVPSMDYCVVTSMTTDCIFDNRVRLKVDNGDIKGATSQVSGQTVNNITITIQYTKPTP